MTEPDVQAPEELTWRRMHPITPLVRGWTVVLIFLFLIANQTIESFSATGRLDAGDATGNLPVLIIVAIIFGVFVITGIYSWLAWRKMAFAIDDDAVYYRSGILFRQQRKARLDRLQAVDTVQPVAARLFGLCELKVEVAGGAAGSAVKIGLLRLEEGHQVRNEILARAAGIQAPHQSDQAGHPGGNQIYAEAPELEVITVPPRNLVGSIIRSGSFWILVAATAAFVTTWIVTGSAQFLVVFVPFAIGFGGYVIGQLFSNFDHTVASSADGIRLRSGMLEKRAQTVPPGRVQALKFTQPLLWRRKQWWSVTMNVAGYGISTDTSDQSRTTLVPVGSGQDAVTAAWLVLPDLGVEDPGAFITDLLAGTYAELSVTTSPRAARILDPWTWSRNGFLVTDTAVIVVSGRWRRKITFVPHARTQSIGVSQGPIERLRGLVDVALHSVPGPAVPVVTHLDMAVAAQFTDEQAARARQAREIVRPDRWMERTSE